MASLLKIRSPTTTSPKPAEDFTPPSVEWLTGTWHVIHSTLPMWKRSRNVTITYVPTVTSTGTKLLDTVQHRPLNSPKTKTIEGIDTPSPGKPGAWDWRGKGWLIIASSHWEVLGYGDGEEVGEQWVVTYFEKTLFTPAGLDVYSRGKGGLSERLLKGIREALDVCEAEAVRKLAGELFEVGRD